MVGSDSPERLSKSDVQCSELTCSNPQQGGRRPVARRVLRGDRVATLGRL